jgi:putative hydrolase of the HAD superfamily
MRAVLLDGLGTLVALEPPAPLLAAQLRSELGIELSAQEAEGAFAQEIAYYREHHVEGCDESSLEDLRRRCAEVLRGALPPRAARVLTVVQVQEAMLGALRFTAYPDAAPALRALRARGVKLVVASNWDVSLPTVLEAAGLSELLDGVLTSAGVGAPKPAGEVFRAALALAGVSAEQALHVGDSPEHDVGGARAAGVAAVLLRRADSAGAIDGTAAESTAMDGAELADGVAEPREVAAPTIASLAELPVLVGKNLW